ncbi:NACHT domain-containing NTPase [Azospirillum sp. B4]|uniref:NACHT domain-containing protein n=1 Tax=Azospirillum sp. B4 TaxID=95605 RepID=UPI00034765BE|nr:hypothetical protein [Azospirillum sp. B4]
MPMPAPASPLEITYVPARLGTPVFREARNRVEDKIRLPQNYEAWREGIAVQEQAWEERPEPQVLDELRSGTAFKVILGEPGAGKSRLLEHWAERARPAAPGYGTLVPLLLPLRRLQHLPPRQDHPDPRDLAVQGEGLADALWALGDPGLPGQGRSFRPLWLLDGLDELPDTGSLGDWLKRFRTLPGAVTVTCRTAVWQGLTGELVGQGIVRVETLMPLRPGAERAAFLVPALGLAEAASLAAALDRNAALATLGGNPLLLTLAALVWLEDKALLPASRAAFYRRAVAALWKRRFPVEGPQYRTRERDQVLERLAATMGLAPEVDLKVLEACLVTICGTERDPLMERLKASGLLVVDDGRERVSFLHLTLQEYYLSVSLVDTAARAAMERHWADPRYEEVLALVLARLAANGRGEEAGDALAWLVRQGQAHAADRAVLHRIGRSPLRTALHLVGRSSLAPEALGAGWRDLQDAVGPSFPRALAIALDRGTPSVMLERLAADPDADVRQAALRNPSMPAEALERLAADPDADVRRAALRNPSMPAEALERLAADPDADVRWAAIGNPSMPAEALGRIADGLDWAMQRAAANNPSTPAAALERLADYPEETMRRAVAMNPSTPAAALERLANDPDVTVRCWVARNPSTSQAALERLADDPDVDPRSYVAWNLSTRRRC